MRATRRAGLGESTTGNAHLLRTGLCPPPAAWSTDNEKQREPPLLCVVRSQLFLHGKKLQYCRRVSKSGQHLTARFGHPRARPLAAQLQTAGSGVGTEGGRCGKSFAHRAREGSGGGRVGAKKKKGACLLYKSSTPSGRAQNKKNDRIFFDAGKVGLSEQTGREGSRQHQRGHAHAHNAGVL